jgi:L-iditol 2-dehydrogenase
MVRVPDGVTFEQASFVEPVNTCLKAIRKARIVRGEVVFVIGQGPIGLILAFLAREAGATVFTSDPLPFRRQMSRRIGAEMSFDPAGVDLQHAMKERRDGMGADAVLLAAPDPRLVTVALNIARPGGRVLLFAQNDPTMRIEFPAAAVGVEEKEILGSYSAAVDLQEQSAAIVFKHHEMFGELISHRFELEDIGQAFAMASQPVENSLKVMVLP